MSGGVGCMDDAALTVTTFTCEVIAKFRSCISGKWDALFDATAKRLAWFQQGHMRNWRIQRFRGDSDAHISFVRLEAQIEALAY
jgi:hypothetical protein